MYRYRPVATPNTRPLHLLPSIKQGCTSIFLFFYFGGDWRDFERECETDVARLVSHKGKKPEFEF